MQHYNTDRLIDAIWGNPSKVTAGMSWTLHGGKTLQSRQYPDGSSSRRSDRTTLKRGTDRNGDSVIWVHCNGDFPAFQHGTIWGYLCWLFNTNDFAEMLVRVGDAYGIEPDTAGCTSEQIGRARQRISERVILKGIADYLAATLKNDNNGNGAAAREYAKSRGLRITERLGAWNSAVRAELLEKLPKAYDIPKDNAEYLLRRLFTTRTQDAAGKWHEHADDYQLAIPYTNGSGNVVGFVLRRTTADETLRKYTYSSGMPRGGYCEALKGGENPVILVEGILDAEAMKQHGFTNVVALGGQTPTDNDDDAAKSTIQTLLRYNAKKLVYIPDYEFKDVKDSTGKVIGKEEYPTTDAARRTIEALLPHMTASTDGRGFLSIRIASLETEAARSSKTKMDADTFLSECSEYDMERVLDEAAAWYEYELKAAVQRHADDVDAMTAEAISIYCRIDNIPQRNRLKDAITAAQGGYLAALKGAGLNASALSLIDKNGQQSTWKERMGLVVAEMEKERTADGMARLLTKAQRIQHADTYGSFAAQVNLTRDEMHKLVLEKPDYLQTTWQLYKRTYDSLTCTHEAKPYRHIAFAPAAVSIVAAPTNHGKTLVLLQTAINVARATGKRFLYLSMENDAEQLYIRAVTASMGSSIVARMPNPRGAVRNAIKNGSLPTNVLGERERADEDKAIEDGIAKYWEEVAPHLALVRCDADIDALQNNVEACIEEWRNNGIEAGGIFVDYLQLLHYPALHAHSRTDEVKGICDRLNDIAKNTKLPVIMAAQFNREATKAGGDKLDGIELANIGESAGIENIAEDVYLVYQIDKINPDGREYTDGKKFELKPYQTRSKRCFSNPENKESLRRGFLYVENLKARDYATGCYCLLPFNGAAGAITNELSTY